MNAPLLPEGWVYDTRDVRYAVIRAPRGFATLDLRDRGYRLGVAFSGRLQQPRAYRGRGWLQSLADDAVKALRAVDPAHRLREGLR